MDEGLSLDDLENLPAPAPKKAPAKPVSKGLSLDELDAKVPDVITDKVVSSPMTSAELEKFYNENPDLKADILKVAPSLPSVQANSEYPLSSPRGYGSGDALTDIWHGLTGEGSIVETGMSVVGNYAYENPGKSAAIVGSMFLPFSWTGLGLAGAFGAGGEAIDKAHPTTDIPSEYQTKKAYDNIADIAAGGTVGMLTHGAGWGINRGVTSALAPTVKRDADIAEIIAKNAENEEILAHLGIRGGAGGAGEGMGAPSYIRAKVGNLIRSEKPDIVNAFRELPRSTDDLAGLGDELSFARVLREDAKTPINRLEIIQATNKNKAIEAMNRLRGTNAPLIEVPAPQYKTAEVEIPDYEIAKRYAELKIPKAVPDRLGINILPNAFSSRAPSFIRDLPVFSNNVYAADKLAEYSKLMSIGGNVGAGITGNILKDKILNDD